MKSANRTTLTGRCPKQARWPSRGLFAQSGGKRPAGKAEFLPTHFFLFKQVTGPYT